VTAGSCNLERLSAFALLVNVDGLARLYSEAWTVNALTINQDVTVNNHLTSLRNGAGESGTKN
jgi:hypothetical protein